MTLLCRPRGRGNWRIVTITLSLAADLFHARPGQILTVGDMALRVVEVRP